MLGVKGRLRNSAVLVGTRRARLDLLAMRSLHFTRPSSHPQAFTQSVELEKLNMSSASSVPSGSRTRKTSQGRSEGPTQAAPVSPISTTRPLASSSAVPSSSAAFSATRRHSLFGTDDRIVIDLGSRVVRAGFSGESRPRLIRSVAALRLWEDSFWRECKDEGQMNERVSALLGSLTVLLREVFYQ